MSTVIKVVLLAMCFLVLAFCLVGCYSRWDLSLSDNDSVCYLAPAARYSSQFTFHVFFPKAVFGFTQALRRIFRRTEVGFFVTFDRRVICTTIREHQRLRQRRVVDTVFRHSNNFLTGTENVLRDALFFVMVVYSIILTFKRHNFTDQLVSWICTS